MATQGQKSESFHETAPSQFQISVRGFADSASAQRLGQLVGSVIRQISRSIDLSRLDGVTIAFDYPGALASIERGFSTSRPLQPTSDEHLVGVAMMVPVLRNGVVKGHPVFSAPALLPIENPSSAEFEQAIYMLAHECAHVDDLGIRDRQFPGVLLQQPVTDMFDGALQLVAEAVWDEYAACRLSASFAPAQLAAYEEGFCNVLTNSLDQTNARILAYRTHHDVSRVLREAGHALCEPLRLAAYLYGHADALSDRGPLPTVRADEALRSSLHGPFVERMRTHLRQMWETRGSWLSRAVYEPLKGIAWEVLATGGLTLERQPEGGLYVSVPHHPESMPADWRIL